MLTLLLDTLVDADRQVESTLDILTTLTKTDPLFVDIGAEDAVSGDFPAPAQLRPIDYTVGPTPQQTRESSTSAPSPSSQYQRYSVRYSPAPPVLSTRPLGSHPAQGDPSPRSSPDRRTRHLLPDEASSAPASNTLSSSSQVAARQYSAGSEPAGNTRAGMLAIQSHSSFGAGSPASVDRFQSPQAFDVSVGPSVSGTISYAGSYHSTAPLSTSSVYPSSEPAGYGGSPGPNQDSVDAMYSGEYEPNMPAGHSTTPTGFDASGLPSFQDTYNLQTAYAPYFKSDEKPELFHQFREEQTNAQAEGPAGDSKLSSIHYHGHYAHYGEETGYMKHSPVYNNDSSDLYNSANQAPSTPTHAHQKHTPSYSPHTPNTDGYQSHPHDMSPYSPEKDAFGTPPGGYQTAHALFQGERSLIGYQHGFYDNSRTETAFNFPSPPPHVTGGMFPLGVSFSKMDAPMDLGKYPGQQTSASRSSSSSSLGEPTSHTSKEKESLLCAVCGDNAACQHYGVRTCEGCKGFFKRTVQKNAKYVCLGNKDCPVDKRRRNRCQFCRFQKCLSTGMVKEVVRTDSLKGRRGRLPSKPKSPQESPPSPPISLITALVRAHVDTSPDLPNLDYSKFKIPTEDEIHSSMNDPAVLQQFYDLILSSIDVIKTWADKVPGYCDLCREDQDLLFHSASFELLALRLAYRVHIDDDRLTFCSGLVLHKSQCVSGFGDWIESIVDFGRSLHRMTVDLSSVACMAALTLVTYRHGLKEPQKVEENQMKVIETLRDHCTYNREAMTKPCFFSRIVGKIPELRKLSIEGLTQLMEHKQRGVIPIPPFIEELYLNSQLPF